MSEHLTSKQKAERLRELRVLLKSGEYDGADLMAAWIALEEYADLLERPPEATGTRDMEPLVAALIQAVKMERDLFNETSDDYSTEALMLAKERVALCKAALLGISHEPLRLPFGMSVPAPGTKCDHGVLLEDECEACNSSTKEGEQT